CKALVTHAPPAPTDLLGRTVGPYDLERLLGQGGFAWVFAGRELDGTEVAVKVLMPRYAGDRQFESRFRNEAETAAKLQHPNIIRIHSDGRAILSDFGIARAVSSYVASTGVNMTIGTPQYLSPEQAQGRPLDERVDFYALGVTLFKAATGEVPFTSTDWFELARMHVEAAPPSLRKKRPVLSKRFERVVMKCLAKHPDDRYAD